MRLQVNKTYKMLINGNFVRSESERVLSGSTANTPRATRKDVREAVKGSRAAFPGWAKRTAYNRGQILYRLAEMLEARKAEFVSLSDDMQAGDKVDLAIDRLVHYAGWSDKYQQILGSVNPVAMSYFDFSFPEPMGVVAVLCPENESLLGLISLLAPVIVGGNCVNVVASEKLAVLACEFGEVVSSSDVPAGVINILTGITSEILPTFAKHMDVDCLAVPDTFEASRTTIDDATENLKRLRFYDQIDWNNEAQGQGLKFIEDFQEIKTVWHPVGV